MVHVYSFDPGLVCGWSHISVHEGEVGVFSCGETNHLGIGNMLYDNPAIRSAVEKREIKIDFVAERYIMNSKITQSPWSLETIGLIRYFTEKYSLPFHLQGSSEVKTIITDKVIKRAGLWEPSEGGHQMDAVRHALYYLTVKRKVLQECLRP